MTMQGPLSDQDLEGINSQLDTLKDLDVELKKARQAGVDVTPQMEKARESREQLLRLKQTYFPGR